LSQPIKITVSKPITVLEIVILSVIFTAYTYVVRYTQGYTFSVMLSEQSFTDPHIHKLTHDTLHVAESQYHQAVIA